MMRDLNLYIVYNRLVNLMVRAGVNKRFGRKGQILLNRIDLALRKKFNKNSAPNPCIFEGITIHYPRNGFGGNIYMAGKYEPETTKLIRELCYPGIHFVDVGGNIGYFTLIVATDIRDNAGDGVVYSFEPNPALFSILKQNLAANRLEGIVKPVQKAVSNSRQSVKLFIEQIDGLTSSTLEALSVGWDALICESVTLDSFFAKENWPVIDLIKIDVEGAEVGVLQGMKELNARNPKLKLILEFSPRYLQAAGITAESFFDLLLSMEFRQFHVISNERSPLQIPEEISLLHKRYENSHVNLLCEKT